MLCKHRLSERTCCLCCWYGPTAVLPLTCVIVLDSGSPLSAVTLAFRLSLGAACRFSFFHLTIWLSLAAPMAAPNMEEGCDGGDAAMGSISTEPIVMSEWPSRSGVQGRTIFDLSPAEVLGLDSGQLELLSGLRRLICDRVRRLGRARSPDPVQAVCGDVLNSVCDRGPGDGRGPCPRRFLGRGGRRVRGSAVREHSNAVPGGLHIEEWRG